MLLSFYHTCASKQNHDLHSRESHVITFIYYWKFGLYIPMMGFLKMPQVFMSKQVGCTPTQFLFELSYTYSSSASVAWKSLLTHIDIYRWASPQPVDTPSDVRLSSPFCLLHNHHSIPHIVLYPWIMLIYCVKIEQV